MTWALADYGRVIVTYVLTVILGGFIVYLIKRGSEISGFDPKAGFEYIAEKEGAASKFFFSGYDDSGAEYASTGFGQSNYSDY